MRHRLKRTEIIDRNYLNICTSLLDRPIKVSANSTEAVDSYSDSHI